MNSDFKKISGPMKQADPRLISEPKI